ncbi:uncharacterized protein LOC135104529 [Scylla paramamosain]|uniref:uncharacterized protein LOC135104529 n=1 Tax=Scylla paramamosain TaxID=85552 RepID=UPI003082F2BC
MSAQDQEHGLFMSQLDWFYGVGEGVNVHGVSAMEEGRLVRVGRTAEQPSCGVTPSGFVSLLYLMNPNDCVLFEFIYQNKRTYTTIDSVNNPSDHIAIKCVLDVTISYNVENIEHETFERIYGLLTELRDSGVGCYMGGTYAGAFGFADDLKGLAPSVFALKKMISICVDYASRYDIVVSTGASGWAGAPAASTSRSARRWMPSSSREGLGCLPIDSDLEGPSLEVVAKELKQVTLDPLCPQLFQKAPMPDPVEGALYIQGHHNSVEAYVKGVLRAPVPVVGVAGVVGGMAALPCDAAHPPNDAIVILLWFRDPLTTPIFRMDRRTQGRREMNKKKKKKGNKKEEETEDEEEALMNTDEVEDENLVTVDRPRLWWDDGRVGDRVRLEVSGPRVVLRVSRLREEDKGLYTCRVDFRHQPTKTTRVNLTVVEPPERVEIQVEGKESRLVSPGRASVTQVGPYLEGQTVRLTCIARGGSPRPQVSWHSGTRLLDASMESDAEEVDAENTTTSPEAANLSLAAAARRTQEPPPELEEPHNVLTLGPLRRHHLHLVLTCEASNNNITSPVSLAVAIDMSRDAAPQREPQPGPRGAPGGRPPIRRRVRGGGGPSSPCRHLEDRSAPPSLRPRSRSVPVTTLEGGNITRSRLLFIPGRKDDGSVINCTAFTASPNTTLSASHYLAVHYLPSAWSSFGSSLDWTNIKEGDDVYFECTIDANPPVTRVTWKHNDAPLAHNVSAGIIVSNQSLVLQKVVRAQAGRYSCLAHNAVGTSASNTLRLDVKFAPVCSPGQVTTYAVGKYEDAEVTCSVDANPTQESYQWTFNNTADTIDVPQGRFTSLSSHSAITYTPMTSLDYGTLLCWATNPIGTQKVPCVFHIVPAGKPEPPTNCTVVGGGASEVRVRCEAGGSGGLSQHFLLTATPTHLSHPLLPTPLPVNVTAMEEPEFQVEGLAVGGRYQLRVRAVNDKGVSEAAVLTVSSRSTNGTVYQLYDGPSEAEVRDGGKSPHGAESEGGETPDDPLFGALEVPSVLAAALGAGCGLLLLGSLLIILLIVRGRKRRRREEPAQTTPSPSSSSSSSSLVPGRCLSLGARGEAKGKTAANRTLPSRSESTAAMLSPGHLDMCLERDMQVDPESDLEPDVIPLRESTGGGVGGPATILPPEGYTCLPPAFHAPQTLADLTYPGVDPLTARARPGTSTGNVLPLRNTSCTPLATSTTFRRAPYPPYRPPGEPLRSLRPSTRTLTPLSPACRRPMTSWTLTEGRRLRADKRAEMMPIPRVRRSSVGAKAVSDA